MPVKSWLNKLRRRRRSAERSARRRELEPRLGVMRLEPRRVLSATINEVHYDPAADANGDDTVNAAQDEFVEIVNNSGGPLDISGWTLHDGDGVRHEFAEDTTLDEAYHLEAVFREIHEEQEEQDNGDEGGGEE